MNRKIVAIDFDKTISQTSAVEDYEIVKDDPVALQTMIDLKAAGYILILWTCRVGEALQLAVSYCASKGIVFDAVNDNWSGLTFETSRKIYYDYLIDDKNFGCNGIVNWLQVRSLLLKEGRQDILWQGRWLSVISPRDYPYEAVVQNDCVLCLLRDTKTGKYFVRQELVPPYAYATGRPYWFTAVSGGVELDEQPLPAVLREIREETGILLDQSKDVSVRCFFNGPFVKGSANIVSVFYVEGEFVRETPKTDGTKYEALARTAELSLNELLALTMERTDYILISIIALLKPYLT